MTLLDRLPTLFESVINANPVSPKESPTELVAFKQWRNGDDYRKASHVERAAKEKDFYGQAFISEYMEEKWKVQLKNRDDFWWLINYRENYLDKKNQYQVDLINKKIEQYLNFLGDQKDIFPALRLDFQKMKAFTISQAENNKLAQELNEVVNV